MSDSCIWKPDNDGVYETSCGESFVFNDGGPKENGARFCLHCGKPLIALELCADCGMCQADPPSKLCPGCEAYQEHQR